MENLIRVSYHGWFPSAAWDTRLDHTGSIMKFKTAVEIFEKRDGSRGSSPTTSPVCGFRAPSLPKATGSPSSSYATTPSSTNLSASKRYAQWLCPSRALLQAVAIRKTSRKFSVHDKKNLNLLLIHITGNFRKLLRNTGNFRKILGITANLRKLF